jgi:YD repeat-containing protein
MRVALCIVLFLTFRPSLATAQSVQYGYDSLGRIQSVIDQNGNAAHYSYDANGNIQSITRYPSTQVALLTFSPSTGSVGTKVTISGLNFSSNTTQDTVEFNGVAATILSASANQIVVTVPNGTVSGSVSAPLGSATSLEPFIIRTNSNPPSISGFGPAIAAFGDSVTLTGTNFSTNTKEDLITVNGILAGVTNVASANSLLFRVPKAAVSGHVSLQTSYGSATSSADLYVPPPPYTASQVFLAQQAISGVPIPLSSPQPGK